MTGFHLRSVMTGLALLLGVALAQAPSAVAPDAVVPALPIPGSAWRMSAPEEPFRERYQLHVLTGPDDCRQAGVAEDEVEACRPWVDARRHEVRLSLAVRTLSDDGRGAVGVPVPLPPGRLRAWMLEDLADVELVPHDPRPYRQLFVLLVDRSASMYEPRAGDVERMREIAGVLLSEGVRRTFFPAGAEGSTGVLLLGFGDAVTAPDGGPWSEARVLTDEADYVAQVDHLLDQTSSYTDLYGALRTVVGPVLQQASVTDFLAATQGDPAVVVLTQGFHNPGPGWTCRQNVAPLVALLKDLDALQDARNRAVPVVSVVGLGAPAWSDFAPRKKIPVDAVDERLVCGDDVDTPIDPTLEARGVDNRSLELVASHGAGHQRYFQEPSEVARFLAESAPTPHAWYEVRMRLDPDRDADEDGSKDAAMRHRFRAPMPFRFALGGSRPLDASVTLFPNPWWDAAPASVPEGAPWGATADPRASVALLVEGAGLTLGVLGLAAGLRNLRRARVRRAVAPEEAP